MEPMPVQPGCNKRKTLWIAAGFLTVLVLGDRILARIDWPYIYGTRNTCRLKWDLYKRSTDAPTVVFLGCSYEWYGINPQVVDSEASRLTGAHITSLNLSSSAANMVTNHLIARRMAESGRLPEIVYLAISPDATDVVRTGWLQTGLRALGEARDLPMAAAVGDVAFFETLRSAAFRSYCWWDDVRIAAGRLVLGAPINPTMKMRLDDSGWMEWIGGKRELPASAPAFGDAPPHEGSWSALRVANPNGAALRRTIEILAGANVSVRLLEMPMSTVAPPWVRHDGDPAYREFIRAATAGLEAVVLRPPQNLVRDADFFDPVHLNTDGANKVSRWLARDVTAVLAARGREPGPRVLAERDTPAPP